ncbi:MAG: exopolyphosphatase [Planctomycetes bacterium]|nr:exopolyphosphatase [Planctomycetota bacterium]
MNLLTRSDFDGLVCAVFLKEKNLVDSYTFVHPKDVQDGNVKVGSNDILANIPYVEGCGLWFDHHSSEKDRLKMGEIKFEGRSTKAPSAAQVIWDYYGGEAVFGKRYLSLLEAVNKTDSGNLTREEILNPQGWILLSFVMDPRTGLGRFRDYRISNYALMENMIEYCRTKTVEEILEEVDVRERTTRYLEQQVEFEKMLRACCTVDGNVIVTKIMDEETIYCGNRFVVYALFPEQNIEIRTMWGRQKQNVVFACGHSIINRTSKTDVGRLMLEFGGGGHPMVGTCQVPTEKWEEVLARLVEQMKKDG